MNELRPEIAPLAAAVTDAERAVALLRMSDSAVMTCEFTIRNRLRVAGFLKGIEFVDAKLAYLRAPRDDDGCAQSETQRAFNAPYIALRALARGEVS